MLSQSPVCDVQVGRSAQSGDGSRVMALVMSGLLQCKYPAWVPLLLAACAHRCTSGVMKAGVCWECVQRDGQSQSLQQFDRWRLLLTSTGCGTRTPPAPTQGQVWESLLKSLPGMATADFYADMFRLNQPNIFRAEVVTFGWLEVAGAGEVPATIRAEVRCWCSENNKIINR